jgi:hypothetical protein
MERWAGYCTSSEINSRYVSPFDHREAPGGKEKARQVGADWRPSGQRSAAGVSVLLRLWAAARSDHRRQRTSSITTMAKPTMTPSCTALLVTGALSG